MLAKLLKHEFKATNGFLLILSTACLGCALLGGAAIRYLIWMDGSGRTSDGSLLTVLSVLICVSAVIVIAACTIVMMLFLVNRFYKSRFTDEGYLTFTLPVTGHQILLTTVINSMVNMILIAIVVIASVLLLSFVGISGIREFWQEFPDAVGEILHRMMESLRPEHFVYAVLGILTLFSGLLGESCIIMLSVTLGAIAAKKHKILLALLFYYLIHMAISILSVFAMAMLAIGISDGSMTNYLVPLLAAAGWLAIGAVCYFPTHYLITRKLNLP